MEYKRKKREKKNVNGKDQRWEADLQLGELEMLEELP